MLPALDAQDAREVMGLLAGQLGAMVVKAGYEEPPSRHNRKVNSMIAFLRGHLLEKHPNQVILEANGVGYDVTVPVSTYSALPDAGAEATLKIHTHVREDALQLFGFATAEEKTLFERLIGVSGIGPRLAIAVLSGLKTADLVDAIRSGQHDRLVRIPGVGRKTAERIVLELRDKLDGFAGGKPAAAPAPATVLSDAEMDVLSALVNLGAQRPQAEAAIRKAAASGAGAEFEPLFRRAMELLR
jgi:holliday junction DNA helicase RuvA